MIETTTNTLQTQSRVFIIHKKSTRIKEHAS